MRHHLFLEFWLVYTWFFTHWRHHRAVTRLENVRQSNIRRDKKLGFQLSHKHSVRYSLCGSNNSKYSTASTSLLHKHSTFLSIALHLPHLYHSVTLCFFVDFSCVLGILVPHQPRLCLQRNSDVYSEHSRKSKMEFFAEIVHGFQP